MRQAASFTGRLAGSLAVLGLFVFVAFHDQPGADAADIVLAVAEAPSPIVDEIEPAGYALDGLEWSVDDAGWPEGLAASTTSPTVMGSDGYLWSTGAEGESDLWLGAGGGE